MKDGARAVSPGFIEFEFRNQRREIVSTDDIKSIQTRGEGGTSVRLLNDRVILLSVQVGEVLEALRAANGGPHATA
jgi:hypothetical protein